jgi:hypothetical protein
MDLQPFTRGELLFFPSRGFVECRHFSSRQGYDGDRDDSDEEDPDPRVAKPRKKQPPKSEGQLLVHVRNVVDHCSN